MKNKDDLLKYVRFINVNNALISKYLFYNFDLTCIEFPIKTFSEIFKMKNLEHKYRIYPYTNFLQKIEYEI